MNNNQLYCIKDALKYLRENYKVSQATLYRAIRESKLRATPSKKELDAYARAWLSVKGTLQKENDQKLSQRRLELDNAIREIDFKTKQFELQRLEEKYVLRSGLGMELAARAAVLESTLKGGFESAISSLVALVAGDEKKTSLLLQALNEAVDLGLIEYVSTRTWHVLFQKSDVIEDDVDEKGAEEVEHINEL